ncbi:MAG: ATP-binding cassette domain-containing protein [Spirochaetaceae bacterium]|jgi:peptide/nickel transport system ATP-binding protein|nr:ATP-binding cassette domain-containing protein [Spirochaetaceae bacterium]
MHNSEHLSTPILQVKNLTTVFTAKKINVYALTDMSFNVRKGETIGIVGESGCGKTTMGRCIVRAIDATSGSVIYTRTGRPGVDFLSLDSRQMKSMRRDIQMIFQDPYSSLDPRMTVFDIISEPLRANYPEMGKTELEQKVIAVASKTGLNTSYLKRYPHAFSGGQRQRIGIARALVINPDIIVCDEAVSALDVSIQAQVINLLKNLQREMELTYIFISHDLSVVEYISDKVGVMYLGRLIEYANTVDLYSRPLHPYTEALLSAVPVADPDISIERLPLAGEIPNPANPPSGCYFHPRCSYCIDTCRQYAPEFTECGTDHFVACHRHTELKLCGINYGAAD